MFSLPLIPPWFKAAGAAVVIACAFGSGWRFGSAWVQSDWNEQIASEAMAELDAEQAARQREQQIVAKTQEVQDAYARQVKVARSAADGARTELDRLRSATESASACPTAASASGIAPGSNTLGAVVNECAQAVSTLAEALDQRDASLSALQAWVKAATEVAP